MNILVTALLVFSLGATGDPNPKPEAKPGDLDPEAKGHPGLVILYRKDYGNDGNQGRVLHKTSTFLHEHGVTFKHKDHHHKHGGPRPSCAARDLNYCLYDHDYPLDKVNSVVDSYHDDVNHMYNELNHYPYEDYLHHDNHTHSYRHKGHFICESDVSYVRPGWIRNWKGEWVAVVNTDVFPQSVRMETCKYPHKRCEFLPPCYKSTCIQRFTYVKLLCVDPYNPHHRPIVDVFEIPSACSCFVENFVYY